MYNGNELASKMPRNQPAIEGGINFLSEQNVRYSDLIVRLRNAITRINGRESDPQPTKDFERQGGHFGAIDYEAKRFASINDTAIILVNQLEELL